jgi:multisubunit Na+/H+ antiporter MnhC subunit
MELWPVAIVVGIGLIALLVVWRAVRLIIRLALVGVVIALVLIGAVALWYGKGTAGAEPSAPRPATTRRAPAAR